MCRDMQYSDVILPRVTQGPRSDSLTIIALLYIIDLMELEIPRSARVIDSKMSEAICITVVLSIGDKYIGRRTTICRCCRVICTIL